MKEIQKADRETKFSRVRFSRVKAKTSLRKEDMMEWLTERLCNVIELKSNEMIQSSLVGRNWNQWFLTKKSFCTRRSRKKKMFPKFDHKT